MILGMISGLVRGSPVVLGTRIRVDHSLCRSWVSVIRDEVSGPGEILESGSSNPVSIRRRQKRCRRGGDSFVTSERGRTDKN